jgi:tetratricopeptide (TPR) repeat protein
MISLLLCVPLCFSAAQDPLPPPPPKVEEPKITWFEGGVNAAAARAHEQQKIVMMYFTSEASIGCEKMNRETFISDQAAQALKDTVCVRVNYDKQRDIADRYRVKDPPVVIWLNSDGSARDRVNGYQTLPVFLANVSRVRADIGTINESRHKIAANGNDLDARFDVYTRLKEVGDLKGADEQKVAITKLDPQGKSRGSHHFKYEAITTEIEQYWAQTQTLNMKRVGDLQAFVEVETDPELLWDGWMRLANTHEYLAGIAGKDGKLEEAAEHRATRRKFLNLAWRSIPQDNDTLHSWGYSFASLYWDQREELSAEDKDTLLKVTERLVRTFDLDGLAFDYRAQALYLAGQRKEAIEAARKAVELDPANAMFAAHLKEFGGP